MSKKTADNASIAPTPASGLSEEEASRRAALGLSNQSKSKSGKSLWGIIKNNVCNLFTFFLFGIAILFFVLNLLLKSQGYDSEAAKYFGLSKYFYLVPLICNIIIGIVTELRSKIVLDRLKIVSQAKVSVLREGKRRKIPSQDVVLGDILIIENGDQVPVDGSLLEGELEMDESLLTGESATIAKEKIGDKIYSGSFVSSGGGKIIAEKVGSETYSSSLSKKVKAIQSQKSELMRTIYGILNILSIVLIGVVITVVSTMAIKIALHGQDATVFPEPMSLDDPLGWAQIASTASAFAIGVIPTGLVLCTSLSLAVSIVSLAKKQTLIQELYSLENLSRVDVLCLDKTGTLTDGTMSLVDTFYFGSKEDADSYLGALLYNTKAFNATSNALKEAFDEVEMKVNETIPFSSSRKYSGIVLKSGIEVLLGAPEFICKGHKEVIEKAKEEQEKGLRVLALTYNGAPLALYSLLDRIRPSAKQTILYFYENDVDVKIISGDSLLTVSTLAANCGVRNAEKAVSLEGKSIEEVKALAEAYTVFARVSPEQKEALVSALQEQGHKVAMTGDGVNDSLALRKANSSITFAHATEAAKACSDVVLMDSDFAHLVDVVLQGRRVVNNIQRSSILFLSKTFFVILLCLFSIPFKSGQMLFTIENLYLFEQAVIGIGGFLLSLENSKKRIEGAFFMKVIPSALAGGLLLLFFTLSVMGLNQGGVLSGDNASTLISFLVITGGLVIMFALSYPFTKYRALVFLVSLLSAAVLSFAAPASYLGGAPTTVAMIFGHGEEAKAFWNSFFQPWNSPLFGELTKQSWAIWFYLLALAISFPLYVGLRKMLRALLSKSRFAKTK
jgi:cation-transporting P-type ATPase E